MGQGLDQGSGIGVGSHRGNAHLLGVPLFHCSQPAFPSAWVSPLFPKEPSGPSTFQKDLLVSLN